MSAYTDSYRLRYELTNVQRQIEVAVIIAATQIISEDPGTPDHANRTAWATWANKNSAIAYIPFAWPVSMNSTIQASVAADPTGNSVPDGDVQFVVNSNLGAVIADWAANQPQ